jgi:hypothetical protein
MNSLRSRFAKPRLLWLDSAGALEALPAAPGQALDLVVSEKLLQHLVCEPGLPLADAAALQAYARQLLSHYFGAAAQRWPLASWRLDDAAGASALHGLDLTALRATLLQRGLALRGLRPAWAALLQRLAVDQPVWARAPRAALAWVEGPLLTWLLLQEGRPVQLLHRRLVAPSVDALHEALAGELQALGEELPLLLLGYGLDEPRMAALPGLRQLGELNAAAPAPDWFARPAAAGRAPAPDFAAPVGPARHRLAWPLAACGVLVLATAAWSSWQAWGERAAVRAELAALQERQARQPRAAAPAPSSRGPAAARSQAALEQERQRSHAELQGLLGHAWGPLLANVEQAGLSGPGGPGGPEGAGAPAISWLGLDYNATRRELRLQGLAPDQGQALLLVERLSAAPGWSEVVLSRFQNAGEGLTGQRFDLGARLAPELLRADLPWVSSGSRARKEAP